MSNTDERRYKAAEKAIRSQQALESAMRPDEDEVILESGKTARFPTDVVQFTDWMMQEGNDVLKIPASKIHVDAARFFGMLGAPRIKFTPKPKATEAKPEPKPKASKPKKVKAAAAPPAPKPKAPKPKPAPKADAKPKAEAKPKPAPKKAAKPARAKPAAAESTPAPQSNGATAIVQVPAEGITLKLKPPAGMKSIPFSAKSLITSCGVSMMMTLEQFFPTPEGREMHKQISDIVTRVSKIE